jgi:predicted permease
MTGRQSDRAPRIVRWGTALYRSAWSLSPEPFRSRYAAEAVENFRRLLSLTIETRGLIAGVAVLSRGIVDVVLTAGRERRVPGGAPWQGWFDDVRHAARALAHRPVFTTAVLLTLSIGIGAVSAVFHFADPILFRDLPYPDAPRVVRATVHGGEAASITLDGHPNAADFFQLRDHSQTLELVATFDAGPGGLVREAGATITGARVSPHFLSLLGATPILGRVFHPAEHRADELERPTVALITWPLWHSAFGGRRDVIGSRLRLFGEAGRAGPGGGGFGVVVFDLEVIGVLPQHFMFPDAAVRPPAFLVPEDVHPRWAGVPTRLVPVFARLKPGASHDQARTELETMLRSSERAYAQLAKNRTATIESLQRSLVRGLDVPVLLLFGVTAAILILGYVNLTHLLTASVIARRRELALRVALGAGRWRVVRLLLTEVGLLSAPAGAAALALGQVLHYWAMSATPEFGYIYRAFPTSVGWRDVVFSASIAALSLLVVASVPIWSVARLAVGRAVGAHVGRWRALRHRDALMLALQAAFAVAVVSAGALMVRSFTTFAGRDRGYDPARLNRVDLRLPAEETADPARALVLYQRLGETLAAMPGVEAASVAASLPGMLTSGGLVEPGSFKPLSDIWVHRVSASFLRVSGMRLETGRMFTDQEAFGDAPVALLDRRTADRLFPGQSPVGQLVVDRARRPREVIGVVATTSQVFRSGAAQPGLALLPLSVSESRPLILAARFRMAPDAATIAAALQGLDDRVLVGRIQSHDTYERNAGQPRFLAWILGALGLLAGLLAVTGVFAVASQVVAFRVREIGIRLALGARRASIGRLIVGYALIPAVVGVAAGLVAAIWFARGLESVLVGVAPRDPTSFAMASAATIGVVVLGAAWPAHRATRVDPVVTLKAE